MKAFEYAAPKSEREVLDLLSPEWGHTEVLAGGTDLVGLMKQMIVSPQRVVNLMEVRSLKGIQADSTGVTIGAATTLDDILDHPALADYPAVTQAIRGINSMQLQCQGTLGGELCQRPRCWFFRSGLGYLAQNGRLVEQGENRYHAILGNSGPAKFVSASRIAPALIALGASLRIIGSAPKGGQHESVVSAESLYRIPRHEGQRELTLAPNEIITHVILPPAPLASATYEVRHGEGPDYPLAAAAAALQIEAGVVRSARIVLGHVAPTPWLAREAAQALLGRTVDEQSAADAGDAAVASAAPLSHNEYKVQLARTAVKRAVLLAAGLETGGL